MPTPHPCRFCSETNLTVTIFTTPSSTQAFTVTCPHCGATGPTSKTHESAISNWNSPEIIIPATRLTLLAILEAYSTWDPSLDLTTYIARTLFPEEPLPNAIRNAMWFILGIAYSTHAFPQCPDWTATEKTEADAKPS